MNKKNGPYYDYHSGRMMLRNNKSLRIYWTSQMIADIKRWFGTTRNSELAEILNVSRTSIIRKARELGLSKDPDWLVSVEKGNLFLANIEIKKMGYPTAYKKGNIPHNKGKRKQTDICT